MLARSLVAAYLVTTIAVASPNSVLLRYKFHKGDSHLFNIRINMHMNMSMGEKSSATNMVMAGSATQTVQSVSADGSGNIAFKGDVTVTLNGKPVSSDTKSSGTMKISPTGHVTNVAGGTRSSSLSGMTAMVNFPKEAVHVGSQWQSSVVLPSSIGGPAAGGLTLTNKVVKIASSGGKTLVYVHGYTNLDMGKLMSSMGKGKLPEGTNATGNMAMNMDYIFDATAGLLKEQNGNANYNMRFAGNGQSMSMKGVMKMSVSLAR